jgi:hypothetical protein
MSKNRNLANLIANSSNPITDLIASAPSALNTLDELAAALNDDANFATTVTNSLAAKADTSTVNAALALKVGIDSNTGAATLPTGTTAQRPGSPVNGMTRFNSSTGMIETYTGSGWIAVGDQTNAYTIEYIAVAGGGAGGSGGGYETGGGGGAGGYITSSTSIIGGLSYTVTVGAGGAGNPSAGYFGGNGANSTITGTSISITAVGGGGGGGGYNRGRDGGSGGGGVNWDTSGGRAGGSATSGQGSNGGSGATQNGTGGAGGGGGKSAQGGDGSGFTAGNGGSGLSDSWSGSSRTLAGGGGGGGNNGGSGGSGGGGAGGGSSVAGIANTGGGGGGHTGGQGASGGSGIVVIRYSGSQRGTGGTITSSGGYTLHTFTSSGTFTA